jgi:PAS domain-containing protein
VQAGDRIRHFETEIRRPDGMPIPVSLSLCPIAGELGDIVGTLMLAHDITEQHLTQATLAEVESRVEEAEALAHVGSWLWDMRTGAVQWSAEFHRIHGAEPLEFDGTMESYLTFVHPDDHDLILKSMDASLTSGQSFEVEYRLMSAASSDNVRVLLRGRPMFGSDGAAIGQRGVGQEISPIESKGMSLNSDPPAS